MKFTIPSVEVDVTPYFNFIQYTVWYYSTTELFLGLGICVLLFGFLWQSSQLRSLRKSMK